MRKTFTKITALAGFALTPGTATADQTTVTTAQLAVEQFIECANSLFKEGFDPAEIDYELRLNKKWPYLFLRDGVHMTAPRPF
jgi:hypothetical protein